MEWRLGKRPTLQGHINFLAKTYTVIGWLGVLGSVALLLTAVHSGPEAVAINGMNHLAAGILLLGWSMLLLTFAKDATGKQRWAMGPGGYCIGILNLFSVPIGTAIGTYTLWILIHHRRLIGRSAS